MRTLLAVLLLVASLSGQWRKFPPYTLELPPKGVMIAEPMMVGPFRQVPALLLVWDPREVREFMGITYEGYGVWPGWTPLTFQFRDVAFLHPAGYTPTRDCEVRIATSRALHLYTWKPTTNPSFYRNEPGFRLEWPTRYVVEYGGSSGRQACAGELYPHLAAMILEIKGLP